MNYENEMDTLKKGLRRVCVRMIASAISAFITAVVLCYLERK